jgi:hypothetical protein
MTASPTVLLDLHDGNPFRVSYGWDMSPAKYDKGWASSPMRHGARNTRSVAQNITLTIQLEMRSTTDSAAATAIENLGRQLAANNILKVQTGAPNPVFYRTFGNPDYAMQVRNTLLRTTQLQLQIDAEPFAYGVRVDLGTFTVSNDPTAATNPCRFDVTGVQGDVATPLMLVSTTTGSTGAPSGLTNKWSHFATRRRGTPGNYSNLVQGEAMTLGTDASTVADANAAGGSKARISFATNTTLTPLRLSDSFPANGVSTVEARGEYRVYARVAQTVAGDTISLQLGYGSSSTSLVLNDAQIVPAVTSFCFVDLGFVPVPTYADPGTLGYSGVASKVQMPFIGLYASRTGTGNLDIDYLYFVPADESTLIVKFPSNDTTYAIDGTTEAGGSVYAFTTALDEVISTGAAPQITAGGGFPELIPGATNRIHFIRNVDPTGVSDPVGNTTTFAAYYWPRWREYSRT